MDGGVAAAAAAKSLQSCRTPCNPIDSSPPGSPVPGILQARTLEWAAISFSSAWKWKVKSEVAQSCPTVCDPMDCVAQQAPPSMAFSRQEYWSRVPLPSLMDGVGSCKQLLTTCTHPLSTSPMLVHNWGPGVVTGAPGWMANSEFIPQLSAFRGKIKFSGKISCLWKKRNTELCANLSHICFFDLSTLHPFPNQNVQICLLFGQSPIYKRVFFFFLIRILFHSTFQFLDFQLGLLVILFFFLAAPTRYWTQATAMKSPESWPLGHQGTSPRVFF